MTEPICEVVITADDAEWLATFSRTLVQERWCACAQHFVPILSIYRWGGRVEEATEARVALHTSADLVPAIIERIKQDHPYDIPCILVLPVMDANPDYAAWVRAEVREAPDPGSRAS
ncbi:MAG: divalent-cation tolerance protein CutA [Actinomycetota bacterium]